MALRFRVRALPPWPMLLLALFFCLPAPQAIAAAISFTEHTINANFNGATAVYATDVDGDGDMDVLGAANIANDITWWENDGSESFTERTIKGNFNGAASVFAADVDGDSDMDVLGAADTADDITWWENDGSENFTERTISGAFDGATAVFAADVDGDSDMDVLGAASNADDITWWQNDGSENFTERTISGSFDGAIVVYAMDVDGDGDTDVLGAANTADDITWWENDGSENFTEHTINGAFDGATSVYARDVDGDSDVDVLGTANVADDITWWENDGSENFTEHTINGAFDGATAVFAADVDGDGDMDVLGAADTADDITWWENDGAESFTERTIGGNFNEAASVYAADVDGDGDTDVLGAASTAHDITWWEGTDPPPTVSSLSPADNASAVSTGATLQITFSEAVTKVGTGNIVIRRSANGSIAETINVATGNLSGCGTTTVTITPSSLLAYETGYYVEIEGTAFYDSGRNAFTGISDAATWNFMTESGGVLSVPQQRDAVDKTNPGIDLTVHPRKGNVAVRVQHDNKKVADFTFDFSNGDRDLSNLSFVRDDDNFRSLAHGLSTQTGVVATYTIYLKKSDDHDRIRVCSGKTTEGCTSSDNWSFLADSNGAILETNGGFDTSGVTVTVENGDWVISGLTGTSAQGESSGGGSGGGDGGGDSGGGSSGGSEGSGSGGRRGDPKNMAEKIDAAHAFLLARYNARPRQRIQTPRSPRLSCRTIPEPAPGRRRRSALRTALYSRHAPLPRGGSAGSLHKRSAGRCPNS